MAQNEKDLITIVVIIAVCLFVAITVYYGVFIFIKNKAAHEESVDELLTPQLKLEQQINRTPEQKAYNYEEEYNKMIKKSKEEYELFMKQREHPNKNDSP